VAPCNIGGQHYGPTILGEVVASRLRRHRQVVRWNLLEPEAGSSNYGARYGLRNTESIARAKTASGSEAQLQVVREFVVTYGISVRRVAVRIPRKLILADLNFCG
jgi:hypothetical protein